MSSPIQEILREHADAFIEDHGEKLTEQHRKVIAAIRTCGSPKKGTLTFRCTDCGLQHALSCSCGNRMCPTCQTGKTADWLDRQLQKQLPTHYFLITFTVPEQLHPLFILKPKAGFSALFNAASQALKTLAGNPRFLGVDLPGFFGVLHTWGRVLNYHPHIHFVVPGGGIDKAKKLWRSTRQDFYAPGQALAKVFKGIFLEAVKDAGVDAFIDPAVRLKKWTVDCEAVGQNREGIIKYLAPYVFKTAITDSRIVAVTNGKVTFTYIKSGSRRKRRMTLDVNEFIRRYLMHVLPQGFMRIRHYGFMGAGCAIAHKELVALVRMAQAFEVQAVDHIPARKQPLRCPKCGGPLVANGILDAAGRRVAGFTAPRPQRE
mgnify:FL=1